MKKVFIVIITLPYNCEHSVIHKQEIIGKILNKVYHLWKILQFEEYMDNGALMKIMLNLICVGITILWLVDL